MTSLASVARELGSALGDQIHLQLSPERLAAVAARQSRDAAAYDAYLRGRRFWNQLTPATTRKAIEYYTRATEIDPSMRSPGLALPKLRVGADQRRRRAVADVAAGPRRRRTSRRGQPEVCPMRSTCTVR